MNIEITDELITKVARELTPNGHRCCTILGGWEGRNGCLGQLVWENYKTRVDGGCEFLCNFKLEQARLFLNNVSTAKTVLTVLNRVLAPADPKSP